MLDLFCLIVLTTFFAYLTEREKNLLAVDINNVTKKNRKIEIFFILLSILISFILFAGLRTGYNDTKAYIYEFSKTKVGLNHILSHDYMKSYSGFFLFRTLIKTFTDNWHIFLIIIAAITNTIYICFFNKHSKTFTLTILFYIVMGPFIFSMAGLKQILAMSISVLAIQFLLKNKTIIYVLLIFVAMTFHPYIFVMLILPFLTKETWSKFTWLIILFVILSSIFIDEFMTIFLSATENIGQNYNTEMMLAYGVNPLRVVIELIPAMLSYFAKNKINNSGDKVLILGCNMLLLKALMTFISLFVNPLFAYRVGVYFSSLNAVIVPWMLVNVFSNNKSNKFIVCAYLIFLTVYQLYDTCGFSWPLDRFLHIGITEIFN